MPEDIVTAFSVNTPYVKHAGTVLQAEIDAGTAAVRAFLFQRGWCLAIYLCYSFIYKF